MNNVPRLDLAPKLKRPLSLKNPLDYLILLYWVFFFPQAIRWYIEIDVIEIKNLKTFKQKWQYLLTQPKLVSLFIQSILLVNISTFLIKYLILFVYNSEFFIFKNLMDLMDAYIDFNLTKSLISDILFFIILFLLSLLSGEVSVALVIFIGFPVRLFILSLITWILLPTDFLFYGFFFALAMCMNDISAIKSNTKLKYILLSNIFIGFLFGILFWLLYLGLVISKYIILPASIFSLSFVLLLLLVFVIFITIPWLIFYIRLENWLLLLPFKLFSKNFYSYYLPHTTLLPLPRLHSQIVRWLRDDLEMGVKNLNELQKYTMQFLPIITAVNQVLDKIPEEQVIYYLNELVKNPYNWDLIYFCSISFKKFIKSFLIFVILSPIILVSKIMSIFLPKSIDISININIINKDSIPNKVRHLVADGFWQLHEKKPQLAKKAFFSIQNLSHGQELFLIADIFSNLTSNHDYLNYIISVELPQEELIRQDTWKVIKQLQKIAQDTLLTEKSPGRLQRSLANNRAIGELEKILENPNILPELERAMIIDIAQDWQRKLAQNASVIGDNSISEPIPNPYVIGDPVIGQLFVGREDIIRQLKEIWLVKNHTQSISLFGHRRMGKTSILLNISDKLGSRLKLAYINLNSLGDIAGVDEVFMAITDAISEELNIAPPDDQDLSQSPYPTFRRYLKHIAQNNLTEYSLIIALDEFETIEDLINTKKISSDFLGFLRSMVQLSSKIAFAFAGLHTLDEMTSDYFQPFFASIIPIRVNFLSQGATRQLLANPNDEFPLDYQPEALDLIYQLTLGQPYLVQLIGFFLVRHYNDQVFEMGKPRDPILTIEDVNTIINNPEFFKNGRYYFTGVWGQASHNAPAQQEILRAIAPHPQGLDIVEIEAITGIDQTILETALKTLERHDVIQEKTGKWSIIVELFRRWVEQEKLSNS
jgi:hypothetical protein